MRRKYISIRKLIACRSERPATKKDIHTELQETIAERKRILPDWENLFLDDNTDAATIHRQLKATIAELKRTKQVYANFFTTSKENTHLIMSKKAA